MSVIIYKFQIGVSDMNQGAKGELLCDTQGVSLPSHQEVRNFAEELSLETKGWIRLPEKRENVWIEVEEKSDSQQLKSILCLLETRYGVTPCSSSVRKKFNNNKEFGVKRLRIFSESEIAASEYLTFGITNSLGHAVFRTEEQFAADQYVTDKVANLKKDPAMGCLSPFQALVVMPQMREILLKENLVGLDVNDEVIGSNGKLFKLGSAIILPRTLTRIVNMHGEDVDPDIWKVTTIHGGTEDHIYDDGHRPCIIRYRREEFESLAPFDVAMTYEHIGNHKQGAYRGLIVSQKFRQLLKQLKVRGTYFSPIQLE